MHRPNEPTDRLPPSPFAGRHVHFVGIGGAGMSGLARVLLDAGASVTGTDPGLNEQTADLAARGATIESEQRGRLIRAATHLVVRTAAVRDDNAEMRRAAELGVPTTKYADLLGQVMADRAGVAVAGTHGKSTTTALLCHALREGGIDPSFVIGGHVPQLGGNSHSGRGAHFVVEACEYDRSFHKLRPRVAVINNIDADHLDCYGTIDGVIAAFREFALLVPRDGLVIARGDDANVVNALRGVDRPIQTFGFDARCDWSIDEAEPARVTFRGNVVATLRPMLAGRHNRLNALCALATAHACGLPIDVAARGVETFEGVERRLTKMGRCHGAMLLDDYGHHPTEIRVTLDAVRERFRPRRLICVFQPHQYSRTRLLFDDFAASFAQADAVIVPDIYSVRDTDADRAAVSSERLVDRINQLGDPKAEYLATFDDVVASLEPRLADGDLVVSMGAGPVNEVTRRLAMCDASVVGASR